MEVDTTRIEAINWKVITEPTGDLTLYLDLAETVGGRAVQAQRGAAAGQLMQMAGSATGGALLDNARTFYGLPASFVFDCYCLALPLWLCPLRP